VSASGFSDWGGEAGESDGAEAPFGQQSATLKVPANAHPAVETGVVLKPLAASMCAFLGAL
jgi:hypothetical protein